MPLPSGRSWQRTYRFLTFWPMAASDFTLMVGQNSTPLPVMILCRGRDGLAGSYPSWTKISVATNVKLAPVSRTEGIRRLDFPSAASRSRSTVMIRLLGSNGMRAIKEHPGIVGQRPCEMNTQMSFVPRQGLMNVLTVFAMSNDRALGQRGGTVGFVICYQEPFVRIFFLELFFGEKPVFLWFHGYPPSAKLADFISLSKMVSINEASKLRNNKPGFLIENVGNDAVGG